jgi:hypothetical protein
MGEVGGRGGVKQTARPAPVLAMRTLSFCFENARISPDHRPVAELVCTSPPLQEAEASADRGVDPVGADDQIGAQGAPVREMQPTAGLCADRP